MIKNNSERWSEIQQLGIKDFKISACILSAISKVQNEFGPIDFTIEMSKEVRLSKGALACCVVADNTIILNKEYFGMSSYDTLETMINRTIKNQFHPNTKMKVSSIVVHELCHAVWNTIEKNVPSLKSEVETIMKRWIKFSNEHNKGAELAYASANIYEFWAEMLTQSLCGTPDEFTEEVKALATKYMVNRTSSSSV